MKSYKEISLLLLSIIAITFSSNILSIARYSALPLSKVPVNFLDDQGQNIDFAYRLFNKFDCKKYLGNKKIIAKGYQPLQVQITNNSDQSVKFSLSNFSFPCVPYEEVAEQIHFSAAKRGLAWILGGLVIWPLIVVGIIDIVESPRANDRLDADFYKKSLTDQIIQPHTSINGLIFVANEQFTPNFVFAVTDQNNRKVEFSLVEEKATKEKYYRHSAKPMW